jgi:TusA-related sulfurtransferase
MYKHYSTLKQDAVMNKSFNNTNREDAKFFLDITTEICPMTFVRTRLMIEKMSQGDIAEVRLQGAEPLENIPSSAKEMGIIIVSIKPEDKTTYPHGIHRLLLRKA